MDRVFFLYGLPDNNVATVGILNGHQQIMLKGNCNVHHQLQKHFDAVEVMLMGEASDHKISWGHDPNLIFNQIANPDTHAVSLDRAERLCKFLDVPVINPPAAILKTKRHLVSEALKDLPGLIVPHTICCQPTAPEQVAELVEQHDLNYPVIVRVAGTHSGKNLVKIDSADEMSLLHALPLDGRDFYITQFVEYRSPDGLYRVCRIAFVGGKAFLRHWLCYTDWNVHFRIARDFVKEQNGDLVREEENMTDRFYDGWAAELQPIFDPIIDALHLDFFGVDGNLTEDGKFIVFEANASMNMLTPDRNDRVRTEFRQQQRDRLEAALVDMIKSKLGS